MLVTIYKLEDDAFNEALCKLNNGQHTLGRGPLLQCADKRVSRNHIAIEISHNNATITAKHEINPCFYRAAESKHISILKYNQPLELSSGDSFGFFPDQFWFKLTISEDVNSNNNVCKTANKRLHEGNEEEGVVKVARLSENGDHIASTSNGLHNELVQNVIEETSHEETNGIETNAIEETSHEEANEVETNAIKEKSHEEANEVETNEEKSHEEANGIIEDMPCDELLENNGEINRLNEEALHIDVVPNELNEEPSLENVNIQSDLNNISHETTAEDNIEANISIHSNTTDDDPINETLVTVKEAPLSENANVAVKKELLSDDEIDPNKPSCSTANTGGATVKTEKQDDDAPPAPTIRDRCWYGTNCYRKNDSHKLQFSHAGDDDYDTDENDDRPQCEYGARCYRKNSQHRKDFQHARFPKSPNPKPKNTKPKPTNPKTKVKVEKSSDDDDDKVDIRLIVKTKRPRKKKQQLPDTPSDDYDYDDPFLDDSGDEYEMESSYSEDESEQI